jgi:cell division protein FtsN
MTSVDWAGRAPTFVVHFSSYRERAKAEADAAALSRRYGRPAYAAEVTVASGVWYRVVLGDFPTAAAARAFRAQLAVAGAPDLGGVYRLTPP